jgi:outer membrane protein assembly factor BamA
VVFRSAAPRSNIAEVHFTGNEIVPTSLLVNTLADVAVGVPFSETPVRVLLDSSIRPLYEARGLLRVTFPRITTEKATKVEGVSVTVAVNEGPIYALGTVQFTGAAAAKAKTLLDDADWKKGEPVNFDQIKASLDKIEAGFRREGYLRVSSRVDRNIHDREHSVDLSVAVDPGPQYTLGKLEIIGLDLNSEPAIRKMWTIGPGNPFDPAYPDEFLKRVRNEDLFDNLGTTRAETQVNEDSKTVDVKLYFPGAAAEAADKQKRTRIPQ